MRCTGRDAIILEAGTRLVVLDQQPAHVPGRDVHKPKGNPAERRISRSRSVLKGAHWQALFMAQDHAMVHKHRPQCTLVLAT